MLDYKKIKDDNVVLIQESERMYDMNFLIPVRGRKEFAQPMYDSFLKAKTNTYLSVTYTVIEHSETPDHAKFCKKNKLNYIWIKSNPGELFNKCLCYNMGALYSNVSKYIIFHDVDCLIQSDFFGKIAANLVEHNCKAMQCFKERRVLYCDQTLTETIINKEIGVDELSLEHPNVDLPRLGGKIMLGAPGGSILVDRELFFDVGGYDDDLFLANSPEDAYFWEKIDTVDKMYTANKPAVDIFHMYHPPTYMDNPHINQMKKVYENFKSLSLGDRTKVINARSEHLKKFR